MVAAYQLAIKSQNPSVEANTAPVKKIIVQKSVFVNF